MGCGVSVDDWNTELYNAALYGKTETCKECLENGANVRHLGKGVLQPLYVAAWFGHPETCEFLLSKGADISCVTLEGKTPLWIAAQNGHFDVVRLLMEKGAKNNAEFIHGVLVHDADVDVAKAEGHDEIAEYIRTFVPPLTGVGLVAEFRSPGDVFVSYFEGVEGLPEHTSYHCIGFTDGM